MMSSRPWAFSGRIYETVFGLACGVWILPELIAAKVKQSEDRSRARDHGSLNLIAALWIFGIAADLLLSFYVRRAAFSEGRNIFVAGICLMVAGTAFRWYSAAILGKHFTFDVAIQAEHKLVEAGPYRYIRHPSYTGALLTLIGFGLALGNWAGLLANVFCLGLAYSYRIRVEEAALVAALGDNYSQYAKRTWRLVPFLF
jgi:protein-S-isoprenylcysteine O-methyltransferase